MIFAKRGCPQAEIDNVYEHLDFAFALAGALGASGARLGTEHIPRKHSFYLPH
jgi:hypothetical protein